MGVELTCPGWRPGASADRPRALWGADGRWRMAVGHTGCCLLWPLAISHGPFALFQAAVAGLEPASDSLTGSRLTIRPHRSLADGGWHVADGQRDSGYLPSAISHLPGSAQRELNPHIRHGKATGCRYIMGAEEEGADARASIRSCKSPCRSGSALSPLLSQAARTELSKNGPRTESCVLSRAPGGTRTHVAALRMRSPGRWTTGAEEVEG